MRKIMSASVMALAAAAAAEKLDGAPKSAAKPPVDEAPEASGERPPVTVRGRELLALIAEAGDEGLMLTQDEGMEAVQNGFAVVDTSVVDGNTAKVTLTDAGRASLAGSATPTSKFELDDDIPLPTEKTRRGRSGGYPFETMAVNQSFHVACDKDETPEDVAARLQSSVSGARAKFASETGETEPFVQKTYAKGDDGKFLKDADGKRVVASSTTIQRPKKTPTRDFMVKAVNKDDPKGPGARVWRTK